MSNQAKLLLLRALGTRPVSECAIREVVHELIDRLKVSRDTGPVAYELFCMPYKAMFMALSGEAV